MYTYKPSEFFLREVAKLKAEKKSQQEHHSHVLEGVVSDNKATMETLPTTDFGGEDDNDDVKLEGVVENNDNLKEEFCYIQETVSERKLGYTDRQVRRALMARILFHNMGAPSLEAFERNITYLLPKG